MPVKPFKPTPELLEVAARVVWFKDPAETLKDPIHFLAYAMRYGTTEDLVMLERAAVGIAEYSEVINNSPAGIFDPRSWNYWNLICGKTTVPALPIRRLG